MQFDDARVTFSIHYATGDRIIMLIPFKTLKANYVRQHCCVTIERLHVSVEFRFEIPSDC